MDIEQLRLILETVSAVSGDAVSVFIAYIFFENVLPFIGWMICVYLLYKTAIMFMSQTSDEDFFKDMRDTLRTGLAGPLLSDERERTKKRLREIARESKS